MTTRQRRAMVSAVSAFLVAGLCMLLAAGAEGGRRTLLVVLMLAWLMIAAGSLAGARRQVEAVPAVEESERADDPT